MNLPAAKRPLAYLFIFVPQSAESAVLPPSALTSSNAGVGGSTTGVLHAGIFRSISLGSDNRPPCLSADGTRNQQQQTTAVANNVSATAHRRT
jgi:hypothetical protein